MPRRHALLAAGILSLSPGCGAATARTSPDASVPDASVPDAPPPTGDRAPTDDGGTAGGGVAVVTYQFDGARTGANRAEHLLTPAAVGSGRFGRDPLFAPVLDGDVYAQPLYLPAAVSGAAGRDLLFVATQANSVFALDAATGATVWRAGLGVPVARATQPCGNISPTTGVLGTPVIDLGAATLYAVAFTDQGGARVYTLHALDVGTGAPRAGYPVALHPPPSNGSTWDPDPMGERGALARVGATVYVPFGGLAGDCGLYHGWVVGIDTRAPTHQTAFATPGASSGIWAPGGVAADATGRLYVATGNGLTDTSMGEHVLRFGAGLGAPDGFFTPSDQRTLDAADVDLGSVAPLVVPRLGVLFQGGKAGVGYLLDPNALGGRGTGDGSRGEGLFSTRLFSGEILGAAAAWADATDVYLFVSGRGERAGCAGTGGVEALRMAPAGIHGFTTAWCSSSVPEANPPAVSSDGDEGAILWVAGATTVTSAPSLRAYRIADGAEIWTAVGPDAPPSVRHWVPPVVSGGRVYVTGAASVALYDLR